MTVTAVLRSAAGMAADAWPMPMPPGVARGFITALDELAAATVDRVP